MAREFGRFNIAIWQDPDWRELPPPAQHLYMLLWTHPQLSYCGVVDWRPGRLAAFAKGWTAEDIRLLADCLEARHFIVVDEDTEEALVRSWMRFDGLMKQPRLAVSFANAYAGVSSNLLRGVIVHEMLKLQEIEPTLPAWNVSQIQAMNGLPSVDPKSREGLRDPFTDGFAYDFGHAFGDSLGQTRDGVRGLVSVPPTTTTATSTVYSNTQAKTQSMRDTSRFVEFWNVYPIKRDKKKAQEAYERLVRKGVDQDRIIAGARTYAEFQRRPGAPATKYAQGWLSGERWEDEDLLHDEIQYDALGFAK